MMPCPCCGRGDVFGEAEDINPLLGIPLGGWHDNRPTHAEIVNEAVDGLRADLQASPATDAGEVRTAPSDDWQPIETAPKDGTEFLAAWEDVERGRYVYGVIAWIDPRSDGLDWHEGDSIVGPPKYWRPLPAPPAAAIRGLAR